MKVECTMCFLEMKFHQNFLQLGWFFVKSIFVVFFTALWLLRELKAYQLYDRHLQQGVLLFWRTLQTGGRNAIYCDIWPSFHSIPCLGNANRAWVKFCAILYFHLNLRMKIWYAWMPSFRVVKICWNFFKKSCLVDNWYVACLGKWSFDGRDQSSVS